MHEIGTVLYIIRAVEKVCRQYELTEVISVTLEIGEVSGILPDYLYECWKWAVQKNEYMREAGLNIETLEAVTFCGDCHGEYSTVKYAKICPYCGSGRTWLLKGNEYNIKEIEAR